jgi:hypothetical protein
MAARHDEFVAHSSRIPEAFSDNDHGLVAAQILQNFHFANHPTRDRNGISSAVNPKVRSAHCAPRPPGKDIQARPALQDCVAT